MCGRIGGGTTVELVTDYSSPNLGDWQIVAAMKVGATSNVWKTNIDAMRWWKTNVDAFGKWWKTK